MDEIARLDEEDIIKLTDEELRDILLELNTIQQNKIGTMSLYNSITEFINITNDIDNNILDKIKSEDEMQLLEEYYKKIYKIIENIDERIKNTENELMELKDLRNGLEVLIEDIKPYIIEASYLAENIDYYLAINQTRVQYGEFNINQDEINNFIYGIMSYLTDTNREYEEFIEKTSIIIGYLPFRLTKEKYFEIIQNALKRNLSNYSKYFVDHEIKNYKKNFNGSMEPSFGTKYDYYFRRVQELKKHKNIKSLGVDELSLYSQNAKVLMQEIEDVSYFIRDMGILVNKLIAVFMISSLDNSFSIDWDTFDKWKEYLRDSQNKSKELVDVLNKKIKELEKDMMETNELLEKLIFESLNRNEVLEESINEKFLYTNKVLTYYNDAYFVSEEILFNNESDSSTVDMIYLEQVLNNFIQFLDRTIRSMSNDERKIRMRRLLSILEFPFEKPDDLLVYLESCLDLRVTSCEEIIIAMENIDYIMNMNN